MNRDRIMRTALSISVIYNLTGALLFAFPSSWCGQLAGLPAPAPRTYTVLLAFFVLLFGGSYAWLARQPQIDRPLVVFATLGKSGAFALILAFWAAGQLPVRAVLTGSGDLILAGIFAWWLIGSPRVSGK